KTEAIARCLRRSIPEPPARILVVGCGSGLEAAILAQELGAHATGIDTSADFDPAHAGRATLQQGDAESLEFADESFDLVYSYHALEHIPRYRAALAEMRRVLTEGGHYCVGTPNRLRLLGYMGSKDASPWQKLLWNAQDWSARLRGRFRNEYGAHAGFSAEELGAALGSIFSSVQDITLQYYLEVYADKAGPLGVLGSIGVGRFLLPSVYFIGRR
ncbi:MAG TPA: class I SAM-dependent methyltransferase, partial [Burkholderiales bacterium]|nr:class I SAM-dependent methyltransferase [Burkholderiales bacterium]